MTARLMIVQLGEQHVYPSISLSPSLIAAPRTVELTVIEDNSYLPLAFFAYGARPNNRDV